MQVMLAVVTAAALIGGGTMAIDATSNASARSVVLRLQTFCPSGDICPVSMLIRVAWPVPVHSAIVSSEAVTVARSAMFPPSHWRR